MGAAAAHEANDFLKQDESFERFQGHYEALSANLAKVSGCGCANHESGEPLAPGPGSRGNDSSMIIGVIGRCLAMRFGLLR
jgi:hypothetical protein